jgi:hypothetical protein
VTGTRLRPHLPWSGRTAGFLRDRLWFDFDEGVVIAGDGRGRQHRYAIGEGPGEAAGLAVVVRHTVERFLHWLALLDGTGRPLAVSEGSQWAASEVRAFAERAGLAFEELDFHDFSSFDRWLGKTRPVRLDDAPGHLWPVIGLALGTLAGIVLSLVAPWPIVWLIACPLIGVAAAWAADYLVGRAR